MRRIFLLSGIVLVIFFHSSCAAPFQPGMGGGVSPGAFTVSGSLSIAVAGVQVHAFGPSTRTVLTDGLGNFSFSGMPAGEYRFQVAHPSHIAVPEWGENRRMVLGNTANLDFWLFPFTSVGTGFTGDFTLIHDIQGKTHFSPYNGVEVQWVPGIVTGIRQFLSAPSPTNPNSFTVYELYLQNPWPDSDERTSEGLYINTTQDLNFGTSPNYVEGDFLVIRRGRVDESRLNYPSGSEYSDNLTRTQIATPAVDIVELGSGFELPETVLVGPTGRMPPHQSMQADSEKDVLVPGRDALDFMESLEHMRVRLHRPLTVGPTDEFSVTSVVVDQGRHIQNRSWDGGVLLTPHSFNPEILFLGNSLGFTQSLPRGAVFQGDIVGVVDYSYSQYKIHPTQTLPAYVESIVPLVGTLPPTAGGLTVVAFNVKNLAPAAAPNGNPGKMPALARIIGDNLFFPDIIGLMEIQDNSGNLDDGSIHADITMDELEIAVDTYAADLSRYDYEWRQINPIHNAEGGEPGGNIRLAFLFNTRRVSFVNRAPDPTIDPKFVLEVSSTRSVVPVKQGDEWVLSHSPGRIAPAENEVWGRARRTLAGEFLFQGRRLIVLANHWTAKGADTPLQGNVQPILLHSEEQRLPQARLVASWIRDFLHRDPQAKIIALGDFNDFHWSRPLREMEAVGMTNLVWSIPENRRFSFVFNGNAQILDSVFVSPEVLKFRPEFEIVHCVTKFPFGQAPTDHEPLLARINFTQTPSLGTVSEFIGGTPTVTSKVYRIAANVQMTNPARLYFAVVPLGSHAPSAFEIRAGRRSNGGPFLSGGGVSYRSGVLSFSAPGLQPNIHYDFFLVSEGAPNNFGTVYKSSVLTRVSSDSPAGNLFISEIIEGTGDNKAVEIANFTGGSVNLAGFKLSKDSNGNGTFGDDLALSGTLGNGQVFVVTHANAVPAILAEANFSSTANFIRHINGNDQIALRTTGNVVIDRFGGLGTAQGGDDFYKDATFIRSSLVMAPVGGGNDPRANGEWTVRPRNFFGELGRHSYDP